MNVGILCASIGFGGAQNTTASLASELSRQGHDVTLYIDKSRFRSLEDVGHLRIVDIPRDSPLSVLWGYCPARSLVSAIRGIRALKHQALLLMSDGHLPIAVLARWFCRVPCVYYELGPRMHARTRFLRGLVVANSEETRDLLANWLHRSAKDIPIVRARVNVERLSKAAGRAGVGQADGRPVSIAMASRLEDEKIPAVLLVIDAVRMLSAAGRNVRLHIYGGGKDIEDVRKHVAKAGGEYPADLVRIHGFVRSIPDELAHRDICVGVGRGAWEGMACGRATVVVGKEGLGGVVCPRNLQRLMRHNFTARGRRGEPDAAEIAGALGALVDDPAYRRRLGAYGLKVMREHYDVKLGAAQIASVLGEACRQGVGRRNLGDALRVCGAVLLSFWLAVKAVGLCCLRPRVPLQSLAKAHALKNGRDN